MKKLLLIFVLALLPLQFSWAAAAAYCQHVGEKTTEHFGHHSHQHAAKADLPDEADDVIKAHSVCGYCHLFFQASFLTDMPEIALPVGSMHVERPVQSYSSHIPDGLLRPDWRYVS